MSPLPLTTHPAKTFFALELKLELKSSVRRTLTREEYHHSACTRYVYTVRDVPSTPPRVFKVRATDQASGMHWSYKPNNRTPVRWCSARLRALSDDSSLGGARTRAGTGANYYFVFCGASSSSCCTCMEGIKHF